MPFVFTDQEGNAGTPDVAELNLVDLVLGLGTSGYQGRIAFDSNREGGTHLFMMDARDGYTVRLTTDGPVNRVPDFSPDGSRIAFISTRDGNPEIYMMNADGSAQTRLTFDAGTDYYPRFSPDGQKIVFFSNRDGDYDIYVMNADGSGTPVQLTNDPGDDADPVFSPDGSQIAFSTNRDGNYEIYLMNADGSNPVNLTNAPTDDIHSSFNPDGSAIVFRSNRDGNFEIYRMEADGSGQTRLTTTPESERHPSFSPDGAQIIFHAVSSPGHAALMIADADGTDPYALTNADFSNLNGSWQDGGVYAGRIASVSLSSPAHDTGLIAFDPATGSITWDRADFDALTDAESALFTIDFTLETGSGPTPQQVTLKIDGINDAPVLADDMRSIGEGFSFTVDPSRGVLSNDKDPEGLDLSVVAVNGSALLVNQAIQGLYGQLTVLADGAYSYQATALSALDPSETALDRFTITVSDGVHSSDSVLDISVDGTINIVTGSGSADVLVAPPGRTILSGLGGNDVLTGGDRADLLDGGANNDMMAGGDGDDVYVVNTAGDQVIEADGEGYDTVESFVSTLLSDHVEALLLRATSTARNGTGNALDNALTGNDLANVLRGGTGADRLDGLGGNDDLRGEDGDDTLMGGSGHDVLDGGSGADQLSGGLGNDTYVIDQNGDVVIEALNEGTADLVRSVIDILALPDHVERLTLTGTAGLIGHGNALANIITGTAYADTLFGHDGGDRIDGGNGADQIDGGVGNDGLNGGQGADILLGGMGVDYLTGGSGGDLMTGGGNADRFSFLDGDFGAMTLDGADRITDFSRAERDKIKLAGLDANTANGADSVDRFSVIGANAFSGMAGQLRWETQSGATIVMGDRDGDAAADFWIRLDGIIALTASDFIL